MNHARHLLLPALAAVIALALAPAAPGTSPDSSAAYARTRAPKQKRQPAIRADAVEKRIHALINRERKKHRLAPLAWDAALSDIARRHSEDMAARSYFSHTSPEGKDFFARYETGSYSCSVRVDVTIYLGAENIFQNNLYDKVTTIGRTVIYDWNSEEKIAETTVEGWMNSPGHRKNILTPHWEKEGIGFAVAPDGKLYITQNFC